MEVKHEDCLWFAYGNVDTGEYEVMEERMRGHDKWVATAANIEVARLIVREHNRAVAENKQPAPEGVR